MKKLLMKRFIALLLTVSMLFGMTMGFALPVAAEEEKALYYEEIDMYESGSNLIVNGNFSDGRNGWAWWWSLDIIQNGFAPGVNAGMSGFNWHDFQQDVFLEGGYYYEISYWAKKQIVYEDNHTGTNMVYGLSSGGRDISQVLGRMYVRSEEWEFYSQVFNLAEDMIVKFQFFGAGAYFYAADIKLEKLEGYVPPTPTSPPTATPIPTIAPIEIPDLTNNLFPNADFSQGDTWMWWARDGEWPILQEEEGMGNVLVLRQGFTTGLNIHYGILDTGKWYKLTVVYRTSGGNIPTIDFGIGYGWTSKPTHYIELVRSESWKSTSIVFQQYAPNPGEPWSVCVTKQGYPYGYFHIAYIVIEETDEPEVTPTPSPVPKTDIPAGWFTLNNGRIYGPDGSEFIAKGSNVNGPRGFFTRDTLQDVNLMCDVWKFNAVRLITTHGIQWQQWANTNLGAIVKALTDKGVVVMIEVHDYTGDYPNDRDRWNSVGDAVKYRLSTFIDKWVETATMFKDNPLVWFNIMNEPGGGEWQGTNQQSCELWYDVHYQVINAIREVAPYNIIVLDEDHYGQSAYNPADPDGYGSPVLNKGPILNADFDNIIYSLHPYGWTSAARMDSYAVDCLARNLAFVFGEFGAGYNDLTSHTSTMHVYNTALKHNIGRFYWAWEDQAFPIVEIPGRTSGFAFEIDKTDGSRPTNLTWFGGIVWDDCHGTLSYPVPRFSWPVVVNGNFTDGIAGWHPYSGFKLGAGLSFDGSDCGWMPKGCGYTGQNLFVGNLLPGGMYKLSCWAKIAPGGMNVDIGFAYTAVGVAGEPHVFLYFNEDEWTYKEVYFTLPETEILTARLFAWRPDDVAAGVDVYFDRIAIELVEVIPPLDTDGFTAVYDKGVVGIEADGLALMQQMHLVRVVAESRKNIPGMNQTEKFVVNMMNIYPYEIDAGGNFAKSIDVGILDFDNYVYTVFLTDFNSNLIARTTVKAQSIPPEVFVAVDIEIVGMPKNVYRIDERADWTGLAIKLIEEGNYGTIKDDTVISFGDPKLEVSGFTEGDVGTQTVTVTYDGKFPKTFNVTVRYINITLGAEQAGGAGYYRTVTVEDGVDLSGMVLVARAQVGFGEQTGIIMMTIDATCDAMVSYQRPNAMVDVWLASGTPDLIGEVIGVDIYGHVSSN